MVVLLKKKISLFLCLLFFSFSFPVFVWADVQPQVSAKSAVLMNADNGQVLYAKNEDDKRPMASTTKIMTALITLETAAVDNKIVTITDSMVRVEGSSMGLKPGNKLSLKSLAEGMLVVSGNDAANSAAIAIGGSLDAFAELMNKRAQQLGMKDTHFVTPSGLDNSEHYTTASDLAKLAMAAMQNTDFAAIASQKAVTVQYVNPVQTIRFTNHNKLLSMYEGCIGVKTGFTKKSGRCLVSSAERDGVCLVAVTLDAPDDWNDHQKMLNYGFAQLSSYPVDDSSFTVQIPVVGGSSNQVMVKGSAGKEIVVTADEIPNIKRTVELPSFFYAPVQEGQTLGVVRYTLNGKTLATTDLIADGQVPRAEIHKNMFQIFWDWVKDLFL
ncbi:D-alanyl-D-alanine carboxypeptidase [Clostridium sp. KNHs216]|uniref:D-alanyl-D-alanine carboxypeptidase family protein n=1 Tax=Clostridium sp. KNHs216 TaxID=1550235 RepID=UPI00242F6C41|nr:D-alanyl-D-alanine carboxypeptidase [Clostridium sp. KNHs216]